MTRKEKIESLALKFGTYENCGGIINQALVNHAKEAILAGIKLRDEELLAMEFDEPYVDERGDEKYIAGYTEGARWQHEQFIKAIKGDGDEI